MSTNTFGNICYNCFNQLEDPSSPCPYCGFNMQENIEKYPVALRAGTVLNNRYIVGRVLGQGGFGITYLSYDTKLAAKVAIKEFMPGELATRVNGTTVSVMAATRTEDFTYGAERFQEEARTLAKFMGQPNIAGVTDYFDENDTSYFVMDYIEGISFKTYIANQGGKVSVDEALNVMIPVLRALTAVHAEGFIHRDVTPDNIYISKDGNVKLLDFGSARYSIGDKSKSLDVILKVGYAPKEQYIRRGRQGPYTDVYSCAACFYAALTGYLPPESLERLDQDTLIPPSQAGVQLPLYLERAILKGLAVQPEDRFQSAAEFLDAIEGQQIVELPQPAGQEQAAPAKKKLPKPAIAAIAAAALVLIIGGAVIGRRVIPSGSSGSSEDGSQSAPLIKAEVPSITIDGETFSTDLRKLDLSDRGLDDGDILDLRYMVNLTDLRLGGNNLTDLTPIAGLTQLTQLRLQKNQLTDLTPLAGLTNLKYLNIYDNSGISDLSPLAGMVSMDEMQLPANGQISDLSPLAGMTQLAHLSFDGSWSSNGLITDLTPLAGMTQMKNLALMVGAIDDLSPLAGLTGLEELNLFGPMTIRDLSPLSGMTQLKSLRLQQGNGSTSCVFVEDLSALAGLTQLTELYLDTGSLKSMNGLQQMTKLTELTLYADAALTDISALSGLSSLKKLNLYNSSSSDFYLSDLTAFSGLTSLQELRMYPYGLTSLSGLEHLTGLQRLLLYGSDGTYTDTSPLAELTNLKELYLPYRSYETPSLDLSGIARLTNLEEFSVDSAVVSYEPLAGLTKLRSLSLSGSYYQDGGPSDLSAFANLTSLTDLRLYLGYNVTDISPLAGLTNLRSLYLRTDGDWEHGGVRDISPIGSLTGLQSMTMYLSSWVTDISAFRNLTSLQTVEIRSSGREYVRDFSALDHVPVANCESRE